MVCRAFYITLKLEHKFKLKYCKVELTKDNLSFLFCQFRRD